MRLLRYWTIALSLTDIVSCSAHTSSQPPPATAPEPVQQTVFDPLKRAEDRARSVQGTVDAHSDDTRKQIDAAESGEASK